MNKDLQRLQVALDRFGEGSLKRRRVYGMLGKVENDGTLVVRVDGHPELVHVRVQGEQAVTTAFHMGKVNLDSAGHKPVIMRREDGHNFIEGYVPSDADEDITSRVYARSSTVIPGIFDRFSSDTDGVRTVIYLAHITDADMVDYFGVSIQMAIEDSSGERHAVGFISAQRDGTDDSGRLVFSPMSGGVAGPGMIIWSDGSVQMTGYGEGVATFDANGLLTSSPTAPPAGEDIAAAIAAAAAKATPVDADFVGLVDTQDANSLKQLSWANIKVTLKAYFDGLYAPSAVNETYVHTQSSASAEWTITHNLGKHPSVTVVDSAGSMVNGDVVYDSNNQVRVLFSGGFSGLAYLN